MGARPNHMIIYAYLTTFLSACWHSLYHAHATKPIRRGNELGPPYAPARVTCLQHLPCLQYLPVFGTCLLPAAC
jgi:hypothetical protein